MDQPDPTGQSFPQFADGDVRISLSGSRQYQLHSGVLKNSSSVMRELLSEDYAAQLNNAAHRRGVLIRHKLVLAENPYIDEEDQNLTYVLQAVPLDPNGRPVPGAPTGLGLELENGREPNPIVLAHDLVLGAFYNQPIDLGDSQEDGLAKLLATAFQATIVAENLDCVRIVSKPIEATLLGAGQTLYKAIADNPTAWLGFASRVKSRAIFKEALIHSAGQYNTDHVQAALVNGSLPDEVVELLRKKGEWVKKTVSDSSRYLASYYPSMLLREFKPGDKDNVSRASYGNDIMMWIAVTIFRHWVCDLMASDRTHHAKDGGWAFCNAICKGGDTYLDRKMLQLSFHARFPMTGKGMACVEHRLSEIKEDVKQWILPLKKSNSALDLNQYPVTHFLHVHVYSEDYPWDSITLEPKDAYYEARRAAAMAESAVEEAEEARSDVPEELRGVHPALRPTVLKKAGPFQYESEESEGEDEDDAGRGTSEYRSESPIFKTRGAGEGDGDEFDFEEDEMENA
ncbi:hypothetical protein CKM354_000859900 [Cercospora kikuchii]|uniref:BTB domain-containing protein n=1 Tax=Cercospora kikuchii TaxID=84275 RepID=A0A9P3CLJ8_9PEZI|nr:uncharacterized protein CKM354_000859900 [Cercospora kikuchii]GIZ45432.1 hypothetical protein CKM354_000859900 [Cercospora kikuchii]